MKSLIKSIVAIMLITGNMLASAADVKKYEINVGEFTELKVANSLRVDYRVSEDSCGLVVFNATPDQASAIIASVNNNCLTMRSSTDDVAVATLPAVTVYSRFLQKLENSGDSLVKAVNPAGVPVFKATVIGNGQIAIHGLNANIVSASLSTGNGTILITGTTTQAKYNLVGTGSIQCVDLKATDIRCKLMGTGYIECWPTQKLTVIGASSGKVYYRGNTPEIKNKSIGVKTIKIEE
ncbi:MAG: DUF2807 domain-containing protein [Muribaculum sp.]|nr:DUF2807 domain-containing protein [Muribaculaceae bacterium]MCM1081685.1 DUF2807 domain-containing protein [Muribaculum sp.]